MSQKNSKFYELVRARRAQAGRRGLRRRGPHWLYPAAIERAYMAYLLGRLELLEGEIRKRLIERIPALVAQADVTLARRADDFLDDIKAIMAALMVGSSEIFDGAEAAALGYAYQISSFNREQYRRIINATLGVDPIANDDFLQARLKLFAQENAALIRSIPEQLLKDVEGVAYRGMTGGATIRDLQRDIEARFKVSRARARLIARDQTGKLNAQLTEIRQKRVGVTEFVWNTAGDERVRDSHRVLDGKICKWDDPTVYREPGESEWKARSGISAFVGNPGMDYQCRCFSEPIMDDLIDES